MALSQPPKPADPRFYDWLSGLWKWVTKGPMGVGVVPGAWGNAAGDGVIQIGTRGSLSATGGGVSVGVMNNLRWDGANYKYLSTAAGSVMFLGQVGQHIWYKVASGTAGNTATLVEMMRLDENNNLTLGTVAVSVSAANGFPYMPTCAGAPGGTPTAKTGMVPLVVDSTNKKMMVYVSGVWFSAALA